MNGWSRPASVDGDFGNRVPEVVTWSVVAPVFRRATLLGTDAIWRDRLGFCCCAIVFPAAPRSDRAGHCCRGRFVHGTQRVRWVMHDCWRRNEAWLRVGIRAQRSANVLSGTYV